MFDVIVLCVLGMFDVYYVLYMLVVQVVLVELLVFLGKLVGIGQKVVLIQCEFWGDGVFGVIVIWFMLFIVDVYVYDFYVVLCDMDYVGVDFIVVEFLFFSVDW